MKTLRFTSLPTLFLLIFATAQTTRADAAAGSYQFTLAGDRNIKYVEFDAQSRGADGSATGSIYFTDEAVITLQDVDGTGEREERFAGYTIRADVDSLIVNRNQAVLSATIISSSNEAFIGQRLLLTVEDNGDNSREPDRLAWGIYKPLDRRWQPSDAELETDPGVGLRWWATDAERRDDVGSAMPRDESFDTQTFPLASDIYADAENSAGDIRVSS